MNSKAGALYIVATPIGNLQDISYRAVDILQHVDLILVEDTRNAVKLLQHYAIRQPMKAVHEHNEDLIAADIVHQLGQGLNVALISDAGTPLVSDPGFRLVSLAQSKGIYATPIPGACAAIAALSIAALPTDRFVFEGFLPAKQSAREQRLQALVNEPRTIVFYEAKHRIVDFLESLHKIFGAVRKVAVARELTKKFESLYHGTLEQVCAQISSDSMAQKGEFVILSQGIKHEVSDIDLDYILMPLLAEMGVSKASKIASKISGSSKNRCYQRALQLFSTK